MPYAPSGGTRIYYELHGPKPGAAPAIVFAHGAGGCHLSWWQQVPHFRDRYACLTFDHRGYGLSLDVPSGPGGAAYVDDLRALLDHAGIVRASFVAQSMGGWTCLGFALRHPERVEKLVMADTHGGIACVDARAEIEAAARNRPELPPGVHVAAGARMAREQPALAFLYAEIDALNVPRTPRELGAILAAAGAPAPEDVARLHVPVLFIAGEEDPLIPPRALEAAARHFPAARVERVPEAGHSVYFERRDAFNALVERFLA